MKKRKLSRRFGFETLEGRRLLAADCCMQAMPEVETMEPAQCEVASFECPGDAAVADPATDLEPDIVDADTTAPALDPRSLDLADGMDGYFGSINAENPAETLEFTAGGDGMVDVVLASSFGDAHASLSVANSQGDVIETQSQGLQGFDMLTFEVEEGETYQLTISSDDANCDGHFQLTAGFADHVDQHADAIGSDSTELELVDNQAELSGRLESAGDIDTFRFTATATGEGILELQETVDDARIGLGVSIQDSNGDILAEGATNEMLQISFDVNEGQEYFVALAADEGQNGTYSFGLELTPSPESLPADIVDGDVGDETVDPDVVDPDVGDPDVAEPDATDLDDNGSESEPDMVDGQTTDDVETEPSIGDPSDTGIDSEPDATEADVDSELVDTEDETAAADTTDGADVPIDPVVPADCELVENEGEASDSEIIDEPIEDEPTDAIDTEPIDPQTDDQQTDDQQSEAEFIESTDAPLADGLPTAWVDCGEDDTPVFGDDSTTNLAPGTELEPETDEDESLVDAGDEIADSELDIDEPLVGFDDQDAVDDFFADLGNEIEMNFDFSFGDHNLEWGFSLV